jgi:type IV pilus assembly protein PilM
MFGKSKSLVGLDIGSYGVRAVELVKKGDAISLVGFGRGRIEGPEFIEDTVLQVLQDGGIKGKRVVTAVSGRSVIFRTVTMTNMPDEDMKQAVAYEANKYLPFEVDDVVLDSQRLEPGNETAEQVKVMFVAAKRSLVDEHCTLLDSLGLIPVIIDVDVFALGNAFEMRNVLLGVADDTVRALIDVGSTKSNINIMKGNQTLFVREFYTAGNDITEAIARRFGEDPKDVENMKLDPGNAVETMQETMTPVLEDIADEVRLSFDYFENQYEQKVAEAYLSGGSVLFPGMDHILGNLLGVPSRTWDPTEGLDISSPRFDASLLEGNNADMAIAIGLASRVRGL